MRGRFFKKNVAGGERGYEIAVASCVLILWSDGLRDKVVPGEGTHAFCLGAGVTHDACHCLLHLMQLTQSLFRPSPSRHTWHLPAGIDRVVPSPVSFD